MRAIPSPIRAEITLTGLSRFLGPLLRSGRITSLPRSCEIVVVAPGLQIGTIDAVLAQLCIRHQLTMLTTDNDFVLAAAHCPLRVWSQPA